VTLTRADVIAVGAQLLDAEGIEGLSMRKLATALRTGPATLYWHVRDKDELLALILDDTLRKIEIPREGSWDQRLTNLLTDARTVLLGRPVLVQVVWEAGWDIGPEALRVADAAIALIAESGLPDDQVADAYFALITFVLGFVLAESSTGANPGFGQPADEAEPRSPIDDFANLARYGPGTDTAGMDRRFTYGLTALIEAIDARAAGPPSAKPTRRGKKPTKRG
jgi:TetR/AcrR family transcriptional regulator, tetracycline repressor protein